MGGPGSEREVSMNSGRNVVAAFGQFNKQNHKSKTSLQYTVVPLEIRDPKKVLSQLQKVKPDVAFSVVHGTFGEDGTLQALLEVAGIPYVGSGVLASALCMDKSFSRKLVEKAGLTVPREWPSSEWREASKHLPAIVKPRSSGSSLGISVVRQASKLKAAIKKAEKEGEAIIQEFVKGTEVTCGVIDVGKGPRALPVTEMALTGDTHDFASKYVNAENTEITPARISPKLTVAIQAAAVLAHQTLGCRHISRSDLIVSKNKIYFLETNTLPGLTRMSLVTKAAKVAGIDMPALVHRLTSVALK